MRGWIYRAWKGYRQLPWYKKRLFWFVCVSTFFFFVIIVLVAFILFGRLLAYFAHIW